MTEITPPRYVRRVLNSLSSRGHIACLVGGCVRDMLLGVYPNDWDISTSALPEEVMELFPDTIPTGIKHGTVTVKQGSRRVEVTTFRRDGGYTDHRHPDEVSFVGDLTSDLSRRDFTINAMAVNPDGLITDLFGGIRDLRNGLIRCVGVPGVRFKEDALRMFRALRFSARLGFEIEEGTRMAIEKCAPLAADIAAERVGEELQKLLVSPRPEKVSELIHYGLLDSYINSRPEDYGFADFLSAVPKKAQSRWAALCHMLLKCGSIDSVETFLRALKLDGRTIRCCKDAAYILSAPIPDTPVAWKQLLRRFGVDSAECAAFISDAMYDTDSAPALRAIIKSGDCFSLKYLAVDGKDLLAIGYTGKAIGEMLDFLLDYVIEYPANNRRDLLLSLASRSED